MKGRNRFPHQCSLSLRSLYYALLLVLWLPLAGQAQRPTACDLASEESKSKFLNDQKPGSILVFNKYTSNPIRQLEDTYISITNVHAMYDIDLHMFFVDGSNCSVADNFLCLTPNQTSSFLVSDLDPGVTGYIIVVAVDSRGCPTNFNYVVGSEFIKLTSGHTAKLGADAIASKGTFACNAASSTAVINFDGQQYQQLGRVIAADGLPSRADGNDTMIVLNRIGGNLGTGADLLGTLFGVFYNDTASGDAFKGALCHTSVASPKLSSAMRCPTRDSRG